MFGGIYRDLLKVAKFVFKPVRLQPHFAVFGKQRRDFGYAQFSRFLDRVIHAIAARQTQRQMQTEFSRLFGHSYTFANSDIDIAFLTFAHCCVELAVACVK